MGDSLSIHGVFPGQHIDELIELGWEARSSSVMTQGECEAHLQNSRVTYVKGNCLNLRDSPLLIVNQPVSLNRSEIFSSLSITLNKDDERAIVGPQLPPQHLNFGVWGLVVSFEKNIISSIHLSRSEHFNSMDVIACNTKEVQLVSGGLTSEVEVLFRPSQQPEATLPGQYLFIEGARPGMPINSFIECGWKCYSSGPDNSIYGNEHASAVVVDEILDSVSGQVLTTASGDLLLRAGMEAGPERDEVFTALGLPFSRTKPGSGYQPPVHLMFKELGLSIVVTDSIHEISLSSTPEEFSWESELQVHSVQSLPETSMVKMISLKSSSV